MSTRGRMEDWLLDGGFAGLLSVWLSWADDTVATSNAAQSSNGSLVIQESNKRK